MSWLDALGARGESVAIMAGARAWSYAELADRSRDLARRLSVAGARRGDVIGLDVGATPEHAQAIFACWELGAAFMPLDPGAPPARSSECLRESGARLLLSLSGEGIALKALDHARVLDDDELAYVITTSGSTGRPKGVRVGHAGLRLVLDEQIRAFGLGPGKRALLTLSTAFDASISDLGTTLRSGATLVMPPEPIATAALPAALGALGITHADLPPALLPRLDPSTLPRCLEVVVIGGEPAAPASVRAWSERVRVINVYGPTEVTICTHLCACDAGWSLPLIGQPLSHVRQRVVDEELWLGGPALALGYVARPEFEAQRFVTDGGERWYRTGDRVRARGDELEFVGRVDRQLKVRGRLVSPEEIEARLLDVPGVAAASVGLRDGALEATVERTSETLDADALRRALSDALPSWMLPRITFAGALPRAVTGKVDRVTTERASIVAASFEAILGVRAGLDDDFGALGGHSLAALEVTAHAAQRGVLLAPDAVLSARTPRAIADHTPHAPTFGELRARAHALTSELPEPDAAEAGDDWLLTGATGFLGARLLPELLRRTDARVHVLVRAADDRAAASRVLQHPRVVAHAADVSLPLLGLPRARWDELSRRVGFVLHAAAAVNLALSLDALAPSNVRSALEVARFARAGARKRVTHVSSLATLVSTDDTSTVISERTHLSPEARVFGGYAQSKVMAEAVMQAAGARVLRPGLLTGDSGSGESAAACTLAWSLRGLARLGCVPAGEHERLRVDVTPIDHAAATIVDLTVSRTAPSLVHVASSRGASLADLLRALRRLTPIDVVSRDEFLSRARSALPVDAMTALLTSSHRLLGTAVHREVDLFAMTDRRFDVSLASAETARECPAADDDLLLRYARAALSARSAA